MSYSLYAEEANMVETSAEIVKHFEKEKVVIKEKISDLNIQLKKLQESDLAIEEYLQKNLKSQQDFQHSIQQLVNNLSTNKNDVPSMKIDLEQPTNFYIFALPLVTIFIVLGGTWLSLRTLKIKSKESIDALKESNVNQVNISKLNNDAERRKLQESIISNHRQVWINSLRDELSSFISHLNQFSATSGDRKTQISSKIWKELFKIELLLNPNEKAHLELLGQLGAAFSLCVEEDKYDELLLITGDILVKSKVILKEEWSRVKSFDLSYS